MNGTIELEKQILALPARERERIAVLVWDSIADEPSTGVSRENFELAARRDADIESGRVKPIGYDDFRRATGGVE